jgi:Ca2+-binding EF-hand superfamily protein
MISADIHLAKDDIQKMFTELDYDRNSKLNYREFLAATVNI